MTSSIFSNGFGRVFSALKHPNFRLWFLGQFVSLFGTWMQSTAEGFLIYELTKSPAYLGYVGFAAGAPSWIFMLLGGIVSDRFRRRNLLIVTQTTMMVLAFTLAGLVFFDLIQPWHIIGLAFMLGITNAFDAPARLAFVPELVEREDLTNAISLSSMMFDMGAIIGPATAGLVYAQIGSGWCFVINGATFIAVIGALVRMNLPNMERTAIKRSAIKELREGIQAVIHNKIVRALIALTGVTSMFGNGFTILFPAWAVEVLGGDVRTNGWLYSARGIGAVIGALIIALLGRFKFRGKMMTLGTILFPLFLLIFSLIRSVPLSLISLCAVGSAFIIIVNLINSIIQMTVPDHVRGRVMSIYSMIHLGMIPLGSLTMGQAAAHINEQGALFLAVIVLSIFAIVFWRFLPFIRKIE